jgi:UDP-N-acetylmuramoyl-tripeptide--D-alanyl-D-alanine ligase
VAKAAAALAQFREPVGRGRVQLVKMRHGEITLIDDSYNASPASMKAAFDKLRAVKESRPKSGRTIAVLGDMLELGHDSETLHLSLMPSLINNHIDVVFTAGPFMRKLYDALPETMRGDATPTARELAPHVVKALKPRDLVLVKGSNGSRMRDVVQAIKEDAAEEN